MSDDPLSNDAPADNLPTSDLPYGVETIVIPFTWSGPQGRRLPWRRFGGYKWATGPYPPDYVGQSGIIEARQFATALRDARQTSSELVLSALQTLRGSYHSFDPHDAGTAATANAGLSPSDGVGDGGRGSLASSNVGGDTVRLGTVTPLGVVPAPVTADQLRANMPNAGAEADRYVGVLNQAMAAHGINTPAQRAAFLAQVLAESNQLQSTTENLNDTTAQRLQEVWPRRFPTPASTAPYLNNPEALANHVYANRNGNGDEASGDGYRYRGRGLMQATGRDNYRAVGFENNPEALEGPQTAANTATAYWESHGLNGQTTGLLDRAQFEDMVRAVNTNDPNAQARWDADQRALGALNAGR